MNTARFIDNLQKEVKRIKIAKLICDTCCVIFISLAVLITVLLII